MLTEREARRVLEVGVDDGADARDVIELGGSDFPRSGRTVPRLAVAMAVLASLMAVALHQRTEPEPPSAARPPSPDAASGAAVIREPRAHRRDREVRRSAHHRAGRTTRPRKGGQRSGAVVRVSTTPRHVRIASPTAVRKPVGTNPQLTPVPAAPATRLEPRPEPPAVAGPAPAPSASSVREFF